MAGELCTVVIKKRSTENRKKFEILLATKFGKRVTFANTYTDFMFEQQHHIMHLCLKTLKVSDT